MANIYLLTITVFTVFGTVTSIPKSRISIRRKISVLNNITEIEDDGWEYENTTTVDTRRILYGKQVVKGKRPYMVYLQLTQESAKAHKYRGWLCGGVIVDKYYVLTSAACVEDADRFYVVSGTSKFVDSFDYKSDNCVCNHRRKVVWKCVPKNYKFDFQDSIKWSSNDIAIIKVNKPFKLGICESGCDFPTKSICYNNISRELEKPGTKAFIAGWGSGSNFREGVYRRESQPKNAKCLQEAKVCIMDNQACAKKWAERFRSVITQYMICTKDVMKRLSEICDKKYANCTDLVRRRLELDEDTDLSNTSINIDLGRHLRNPDDYTARRSGEGGFCENDHGGPLIVKYKGKERVVGVISACKIDAKSHSCHGPFLYTSVFMNRQFLSCAIYKDVEGECRRVFRSGITHEEWNVDWNGVDEDAENDRDDDKDSVEEKAEQLVQEGEKEERGSNTKENEQPIKDSQESSNDRQNSSNDRKKPSNDRQESSNDGQQTSNDSQQTSNDRQQTSNDRQQFSHDSQQVSVSDSNSEEENEANKNENKNREKHQIKKTRVSDTRSSKNQEEMSSKPNSKKNEPSKKGESHKEKNVDFNEEKTYESTSDENVNDPRSE